MTTTIIKFITSVSVQLLKVIHKKKSAGVGPDAHTPKFFNSYSVLVLENTILYIAVIFACKYLISSAFNDWFIQRISNYFTRMVATAPLSVTSPCVHYTIIQSNAFGTEVQ